MEVAGGWDPLLNRRTKVKLPPLKPEQVRKEVYFYPSEADVANQLRRMQDLELTIATKRARLHSLTESNEAGEKGFIDQAKAEYDACCEDARSTYLRNTHGKDLLTSLRDKVLTHFLLSWLVLSWLVLAPGLSCLVLSWLLAWLGLAWLGLAWLGLAWLGLAWLGLAWLGFVFSSLLISLALSSLLFSHRT